jgi:hypothetical protein
MNNDKIISNLFLLRDAVAKYEPKLFNLSSYKKVRECGTLYCTAGLAATLPAFKEQGMALQADGWDWSIVRVNGHDIDDDGIADGLFGEDAWKTCFAPREEGKYDGNFPGLYDDSVTDKELALWRLSRQISIVAGEK